MGMCLLRHPQPSCSREMRVHRPLVLQCTHCWHSCLHCHSPGRMTCLQCMLPVASCPDACNSCMLADSASKFVPVKVSPAAESSPGTGHLNRSSMLLASMYPSEISHSCFCDHGLTIFHWNIFRWRRPMKATVDWYCCIKRYGPFKFLHTCSTTAEFAECKGTSTICACAGIACVQYAGHV